MCDIEFLPIDWVDLLRCLFPNFIAALWMILGMGGYWFLLSLKLKFVSLYPVSCKRDSPVLLKLLFNIYVLFVDVTAFVSSFIFENGLLEIFKLIDFILKYEKQLL